MKNFKKLMTLVLAMLALTACEDNKEEPIPLLGHWLCGLSRIYPQLGWRYCLYV